MINEMIIAFILACAAGLFVFRSYKCVYMLKDCFNLALIKRKNKSKREHLDFLQRGNRFGRLSDSFQMHHFKVNRFKVSSNPKKAINNSAYSNITF
ncbi:hypothetical protein THF1C08_50200 [Vibrio jasicida]|uniref:Uncharacterized protein n=1 Tax=Vibrio jasicida TaxID=766224 RepID=A0AAU9QVU2_9VIBR|nr:hypothetical protein THF1C08_50200 [Vibrio jasicida]CAH1601645.1 hypothetical protein THF1A12_50146 [Vibrio jasicida]